MKYQYPYEIVIVEETDCPNPIDGVVYIHHPARNRGIPYARNLALKQAKGSIIVFVDDDITPSENWLTNLLAPFNDKDIGAVGGAILPDLTGINLTGKCISFLGFPAGGLERYIRSGCKIHETDLISTGNCAFRKDIADKVGGFDSFMRWGGEDQDFFYRINKISRTVFNPDALVFHKQRSSLKDVFFWFIRRGKADYYRKCKSSHPLTSLIFPLRSNFSLKMVLFFLILSCALCFSGFAALGFIILTPVVWTLLLWNRGYSVFGKGEFPDSHNNVKNVRNTICSKSVKWNLFLVKFMMDLGYETGRVIAFFRYLNHRLFFKPIVLTFHHLKNGKKNADPENAKYYYSEENLVNLIADSRAKDWIPVPLTDIVKQLKDNPNCLYFEKIFSITFDDAYESIFHPLLELSSTERIPFMVFMPTSMAGKSNLWDQKNGIKKEEIISLEQAERLRAEGIEFGCHTRNHVNLLEVENPTKTEEIKESYNDLSSRLLGIDKTGIIFSYPHGAYDREIIQLVKEAGFLGGVANFSGNIRPFTDLFQIPRFTVFDNCDWKSITKKARSMWLKETLKDMRDFLKKGFIFEK